MRRSRRRRNLLAYGVIGLWAVVLGFPVYWMLLTSVKSGLAISQGATYLPWIDFQPTLGVWQAVLLRRSDRVLVPLVNSTIIAITSSLLALLIAGMAAYALARFRYRIGPLSEDRITFGFLQFRMVPAAIMGIPFLVMFRELRLLDSQIALIIVYTTFGVPLAVWLLREFIRRVPREVEEAALIDGCSRLGAIRHVVIPLAAPGIVAVFVLLFVTSWNEFYFAFVLTIIRAVTLPLYMTQIGGFQVIAVSAIVLTLPPIIAALALDRFLRSGLTLGAVKG